MNNKKIKLIKVTLLIIIMILLNSCLSFRAGTVTPLHQAIREQRIEEEETQIASGADINAQDEEGRTPLHYACANGDIRFVELLINNGADIDIEDYRGDTPLHYATINCYADIAMLLMQSGADLQIKNNGGDKASDLARDIECKDIEDLFNNE